MGARLETRIARIAMASDATKRRIHTPHLLLLPDPQRLLRPGGVGAVLPLPFVGHLLLPRCRHCDGEGALVRRRRNKRNASHAPPQGYPRFRASQIFVRALLESNAAGRNPLLLPLLPPLSTVPLASLTEQSGHGFWCDGPDIAQARLRSRPEPSQPNNRCCEHTAGHPAGGDSTARGLRAIQALAS